MIYAQKEKAINFLAAFYVVFVIAFTVCLQGFDPTRLVFILIFLLIPFFIWALKNYHSTWHLSIFWLLVSLLLFWLWMGISVFWAVVPSLAHHMACFLSVMPLSFLMYFLFWRKKFWNYFVFLLLIIGVIFSCHGLLQVYVFHSETNVNSFFHDPNSFSAFLNMIILIGSAVFLITAQDKNKKLYASFILIVLAFLFFVNGFESSRGVFISLFMSMILLCSISYRFVSKENLFALIAIAMALFLLGNLTAHSSLLARFQAGYIQRLIIWKASWQLLRHSPWYGIGVGNYMPLYAAYSPAADLSARQYAHNDYLQIWITLG